MFAEPLDVFPPAYRTSGARQPSIEAGEEARLASLHASGLLEPGHRPALDRVAACAALNLGAPFGWVSAVTDGAVEFVGAHGLETGRVTKQDSFCDAVVRLGSPLLIGDADRDIRFADHGLVADGAVRAYAGAPITVGGQVLGAVAVASRLPQAFLPNALDDLAALAHMIELLLARSGAHVAQQRTPLVQAWLGVRTLDADRSSSRARTGLTVLSVAHSSPAEQVGIRPADILHAVDGHALGRRIDLQAALADRERGSSARLTLQRAGEWLEFWVPIVRQRTRVSRPRQA